jgi:predicted DNA-binding transcriptional regulator
LDLNEIQIDALLYFRPKGEIVSSEYAERYKITERMARNDLKNLAKRGLLNKHSNSKLSKYILAFPLKQCDSMVEKVLHVAKDLNESVMRVCQK